MTKAEKVLDLINSGEYVLCKKIQYGPESDKAQVKGLIEVTKKSLEDLVKDKR